MAQKPHAKCAWFRVARWIGDLRAETATRRRASSRPIARGVAVLCLALTALPPTRPLARAAGPGHDAGREPARVKFELTESLHIAVNVKLNGAGPFRLIFDLGSPVVLISGRAAAAAGLISEQAAKRPTLLGMRGESRVKEFKLGDLTVDNVPVIIMDHPTLRAASEVLGPIDGIVGYPVFARYRFTIDYPAATMTFAAGEYRPEDVMQRMMVRMFGPREKKRLVSPAGMWGIRLEERGEDPRPGVTVSHVWPAGPADAAGIRTGDRLLTIDGRWTESPAEAADAASFVKPGDPAQVLVRRGDEQLQLEVRPRTGL